MKWLGLLALSISTTVFAVDLKMPKVERTADCRSIDSAELATMDQSELNEFYCGYQLNDALDERATEHAKSNPDPNVQVYVLQRRVKILQLCQEGANKTSDFYKRKSGGAAPDCRGYRGFDEAGKPSFKS